MLAEDPGRLPRLGVFIDRPPFAEVGILGDSGKLQGIAIDDRQVPGGIDDDHRVVRGPTLSRS